MTEITSITQMIHGGWKAPFKLQNNGWGYSCSMCSSTKP